MMHPACMLAAARRQHLFQANGLNSLRTVLKKTHRLQFDHTIVHARTFTLNTAASFSTCFFMSIFPNSFLSVYSEKQGSKNLASLLSSVPFLLLTALYFLCYGLLNLDAMGVDTRDSFDDFRISLPACSLAHWWGTAAPESLPAPEVTSGNSDFISLNRHRVAADGLGDPRSHFISGDRLAMFLPGTKFSYTSFSGVVRANSWGSAVASWSDDAGWSVPTQSVSVFISVAGSNSTLDDIERSQRFSRIVTRTTPSGSVKYAVVDLQVPLVSLRRGSHAVLLLPQSYSHDGAISLPRSEQVTACADSSGAFLSAHALSDLWVEVSASSSAALPRLVRAHSKYQLQPLAAVTPAVAASFEIKGKLFCTAEVNAVSFEELRPGFHELHCARRGHQPAAPFRPQFFVLLSGMKML
jgi:hypothetical protein